MAIIIGTAVADHLTGTSSGDQISGLGGADTLNGGSGKDTLTGGAGNDIYIIDSTDVLSESAGGGTDTVQASFSYTLLANFENLVLTGGGAVNGTGNSAANVITGNSGANVLDGAAGSDTLIGGLGNDTYIVSSAGDVVTEALNQGTDTVQSSVTEVLAANVEKLLLTGAASVNGTGNTLGNTLTGNNGANVLNGSGGNDTLSGGGGADTLIGGTGDDRLTWDPLAGSIQGGTGTDNLALAGGGVKLDLTAVPNSRIQDVETITLTGTGANSVVLSSGDVVAISSSTNTLRIAGNGDDAAATSDSGWAFEGDATIGGQAHATYVRGGATLQVELDVDRSGIIRIELSDLDGASGFRLDGAAAGDRSGWSVSGAGDVDGDGYDDVIVGAPFADPNGTSSGAGYVVFGGAGGFAASLDLASLDGTSGFRLAGVASGEQSGWAVGAGDVNGDGLADLILGAPLTDGPPPVPVVTDVGAIHVVFGTETFSSTLNLAALNGTNGFEVVNGTATSSGRMGSSVSMGDINGDGFDDMIMGSPRTTVAIVSPSAGQAFVNFGKAGGFAPTTNYTTGGTIGFRLRGEAASDYAGIGVSGAGDLNGDGYDDFVVGAMGAPYGEYAGVTYVLFGKATVTALVIDASTLDGTNGFQLSGVAASDHAGFSVSMAGDLNADGYDDLAIGARYADANGVNSGATYVVFGKAGGYLPEMALSALDGADGFRLTGGAKGDNAGHSVSSAGDFNGDGIDDLIIGAWRADPNGANSGAAYVVFGKAGGFAADIDLGGLDGEDGIRIEGVAASDNAGWSVSGAGDVNGDGFSDVVVGARYADPGGNASGASYVVFGSDINGVVTHAGTAAADTLTGMDEADVIVSGDGADTIAAGGGADAVHSGAGNDVITVGDLSFRRVDGGTGMDELEVAGSGLTLDLTQAGTGRITGVEIMDIDGTGDNTLRLSARDLHDLSASSHFLQIEGATGDQVTTVDGGWEYLGPVVSGQTYAHFVNGQANLFVDVDMGRGGIVQEVVRLGLFDSVRITRLIGEAGDDGFGSTVGSAGDVNGDGYDDFIIGAPGADPAGSASGRSYVVFGAATGLAASVDPASLDGTTGFVIDGLETGDGMNISVASAGDVNGDGIDDFIIGGPNVAAYAVDRGAGYVVFGRATGFGSSLDLASLDGTTGFRVLGEAGGDSAGFSVSAAGDVNGDGYGDLVIGAIGAEAGGPEDEVGAAYVVFGKSSGFAASLSLADLDGADGFRLVGTYANDFAGRSVSSAGDVDGDGFDDLLIGAPGVESEPGEYDNAGAAYVVYGKSSGFASSIDLSALDGTSGFRLEGADFNRTGYSVAAAGDVNGDGFADVLVGAPYASVAHVVFGTDAGFASSLALMTQNGPALDGANGFSIRGGFLYDFDSRAGISVSSAGDINGDGFDDLLVGDHRYGEVGAAYVVFGKASGFASVLNATVLDGMDGFRVTGEASGDYAGKSVSAAGDVDGDGFADIIVGAPEFGTPGASYVVFGRDFNGVVDYLGDDGDDHLEGSSAAESLVSGQGNDVLIGGGGADVFRAGAGSDRIEITDGDFADVDGGSGEDTLALVGDGFELDLTDIANTRISGIEIIDLVEGASTNDLTLGAGDVLDLSDTGNSLKVEGDNGDAVFLEGAWVSGGEVETGYITYTLGAASVLVSTGIEDVLVV